MAGIRVTPEQLRQVSSQLRTGASNVEGILRQITGAVQPLGSERARVARSRFQELWGQSQRNAAGLHQALTGMGQLISQTATRYEAGGAVHRVLLRLPPSRHNSRVSTSGCTGPGDRRPGAVTGR